MNGDVPEKLIKKRKFANNSWDDIGLFHDYIQEIGHSNAKELEFVQYLKISNRLKDLTKEKNQLIIKKDELNKGKKDKLRWANLYQVCGLMLIFIGENIVIDKRKKD